MQGESNITIDFVHTFDMIETSTNQIQMTEEQKQFNDYPVCKQCGKSFNPNGEENLEICFECE